MSYPPDDRHERDNLPPRITSSNVTLDKEKYDKNSIRSPQPAVHNSDGLNIYDIQNFKKSSQSRPIAPAATHAQINPSSHFLPHSFGAMYSQMPSIMMQPYLPPDFPFARHIMPLQVSATAGVQSRPSLGQPGRGHPPQIGHHLKPGSLQNQLHPIPGMSVPVHPSTNLQQPRSPSPQPIQDTTTTEVPKGDIKSQAAPTEAHSVSETRPAVSNEQASRAGIHQTTSGSTGSKTSQVTSHVKNSLGMTGQGIGVPPYVKQIHTTTATPRMSTGERTSIPGTSSIGPPSSVTTSFNIPKVLPHVVPSPAVGSLYSQPSSVSFASRPQQLQDHNRLLKPNSTVSSGSFVGHTGTLTTVVTTSTVPSANARVDSHRPYPLPFSPMPSYYDGHSVSPSIPPAMKSYTPIESVVRKPTTIAQVSTNIAAASAGHVAVAATGINPLQLMTSHSPAASVGVVSMGVSFSHSNAGSENTSIHSNASQSSSPGIFSVQNMLATTQSSSPSIPSSTNVTSLSPRPSILRKRQEVSRKSATQAQSGDPMVVISANDVSVSPRSDSALSASHSLQNSPKSEPGSQSLDQCHKTLENGANHSLLFSPSKIKREMASSSSSPPTSTSTVNQAGGSATAPPDVVASPRKKPRKQNVVATEDKYSSSPMQVDINDMTTVMNEKADQEEDEELKFLMLKRRCVSIFGSYKVNHKAAHNHFQRYSDVKAKEERKPSLQEIASERSIAQRATGWKIHHVAAQLDELKSCEEEVLGKMYEFRERLPKYKPGHKRYNDMVMLHELLQGNIQRSQLVIEQLGETKKTTVKILDHRSGIMDILQKNIKRNVKKKS